MTTAPASVVAFEARLHRIGPGVELVPMTPAFAAALAPEIAAMDPWLTLGIGAQQLESHLFVSAVPDGGRRFALLSEGVPVGAIDLVPRWLVGPYLRHLSVLPTSQRQGLGRAVMAWIEAQARLGRARNLWVCVSAFNSRASAFYESCGFTEAALLADLLVDSQHERLLRKQLDDR
jgi:GNAT superfamily N-acetyltransferase